MKAMIFAAGLGTRLKPFTDKHPKALAVVNGKPLLEHCIQYLQRFGIDEVMVNVHHFPDQIIDTITKHKGFGSQVSISDERDMVLETGGGLKKTADFFLGDEPFVVMNVDVLTNLDLHKLLAVHETTEAMATLAVMKRKSTRYLLFDEHMLLCGWTNARTGEQRISREVTWMQPYAFTGIQILSPGILNMPFSGKFSIIDVYLHYAKKEIIKGYDHTGDLFLDVGKPETLEQASAMFGS